MSEQPSLQELGAAYAEGLEFQEGEVSNLVRELEQARQKVKKWETWHLRLKAVIQQRDELWGSHSEGCAIYEVYQTGPCDCGWQEVENLLIMAPEVSTD